MAKYEIRMQIQATFYGIEKQYCLYRSQFR